MSVATETAEQSPRFYAEAGITVRIATDQDGPDIARLAKLSSFEFEGMEIDWSDIFPHWILAEHEGRAVGAVQVCPGRPVGRMDLLFLDPQLRNAQRGIATKFLTMAGQEVCRRAGAQIVMSVIAHDMPGFKKVAKKRGWRTINSGVLMVKRVVE
jgi:hypothetical protein